MKNLVKAIITGIIAIMTVSAMGIPASMAEYENTDTLTITTDDHELTEQNEELSLPIISQDNIDQDNIDQDNIDNELRSIYN